MTSAPAFTDGAVSLESVLCTDELTRRPPRAPDYETENRALVALAQAMADSPRTILQTLADTILEVLRCDSAGMSLLTKEDGGKRFYWPAIAGVWKPHIGGGTPRDFGPCGDVLDRDVPLLFSHFERRYTYFLPVTPPVEECLLVPFYVGGKAVGTIWAIAHDDRRRFDAEDLRQLVSLGRFASSAYQVVESFDALERQSRSLRKSEEALADELLATRRLHELSTRLMREQDITVLYQQIVDTAAEVMRSDFASMQMLSHERDPAGELRLLAFHGFDPQAAEFWEWVRTDSKCTCGVALQTGQRVIAADVNNCGFMAGTADQATYLQAGILAVQSTPLLSRDGKLVGMISTHWRQPHEPSEREIQLLDVLARQAADLIERRQADEVQSRLAAIVESSDDAIVSKDLGGVIKSWNAAAQRMFGYIAEEAVGRSITMLIPQDRLGEEPAIIERIRRKERIDHIETIRRRKDGKLLDVALTISPIVDSRGYVVGVSNTARDITERKRAEKAIREGERRFREMIDALPAAIYTTDAEGRLTHFNPAAVEMSGRTPELGTDQWCVTWKLYNPDGTPLPHDKCPMAISLKEGKAVRGVEAIAERPDGSRVWFAPYPTPLFDETGQLVGGINMLVDISERKQAEHALQETDRRKNEFLATLAHELRNPLNPIRNAVESLRIKGPPEPELEQLRDIIDRQVRHLTRLVDDLLDINRIARDQIDLHKQAVELTDVIHSAVEMSRPLIDQSGHELSLRLPDDPVWLDGDPARLAQVLMNLLNNAAKYTEPGGQIWLDADREDGQVTIRVTDTGIGIPSDKLGNLFELFYQADRSMERSGGGLGIGLALVQRFVEMHGGAVTAHSEGPGMGSQFVVRLPILAERPAAAAAATDGHRERMAVSRRILVVDDNQDSAKMLATLLRLTGNEVEMAFDGVEALQAGERFGPEVVLLDIGMPRLNGYETCRRMRQQPWGKEALLIAQTGWGQNEDKRRTAEAGFNAHFVKPINLAALNKLLADWQPAQV